MRHHHVRRSFGSRTAAADGRCRHAGLVVAGGVCVVARTGRCIERIVHIHLRPAHRIIRLYTRHLLCLLVRQNTHICRSIVRTACFTLAIFHSLPLLRNCCVFGLTVCASLAGVQSDGTPLNARKLHFPTNQRTSRHCSVHSLTTLCWLPFLLSAAIRMIPAEIYPMKVRAKAVSITTTINWSLHPRPPTITHHHPPILTHTDHNAYSPSLTVRLWRSRVVVLTIGCV